MFCFFHYKDTRIQEAQLNIYSRPLQYVLQQRCFWPFFTVKILSFFAINKYVRTVKTVLIFIFVACYWRIQQSNILRIKIFVPLILLPCYYESHIRNTKQLSTASIQRRKKKFARVFRPFEQLEECKIHTSNRKNLKNS